MMKIVDFIVEKVMLPALIIGPVMMLILIIYDTNQTVAALEDVCQTMGGVYVNSKTCIEGKNLFLVKE